MHIQTKLDLLAHATVTAIGSAIVYFFSRSAVHVAVFIAGSIFIDLDHVIDYFVFYKNNFNLGIFLDHLYLEGGKVYLILHSWELVVCTYAAAAVFQSPVILILAVALTVHLAIDNIQRRRPMFYFLLYRMSKGFDAKYLLPEYFELRACQGRPFTRDEVGH